MDELSTPIEADRDRTWSAIVHVLRHNLEGATRVARLLGCDPHLATAGFGGLQGETLPGFRVVSSDPGQRLRLHGRHRFSEYELAFVLEDGLLRARTDAAFPGLAGRLYRAAVIGSGGHVLVTRRLLGQIAACAQRTHQPELRP